MELQDTRFMRFVLHFWVKHGKFKGASRVCAVLINFFLLILKLVFCGVILIVLAPYLAAQAILNRPRLNILQKILYVLLVVICLILDVPMLIMCLLGTAMTVRFLIDGQLLAALIFGAVSWVLIRITKPLIFAPFCRNVEELEDDEYEEEEEEVVQNEIEDDIDDLVFCQLFKLGEDMCLLIDHIEMCPDETAFIRVLSQETYTPIYKRKVRRDKQGNRYIVFNSTKYYLDDKKTQPVITTK
jgi:hypothetical protein